MTEFQQFQEDAKQTHEVFDLCGIPRQMRNNPLSLRIRASMLAEKADVDVVLERE